MAKNTQLQDVPLVDTVCEDSVLAQMMTSPKALADIAEIVTPDCFSAGFRRELATICLELYRGNEECDLASIVSKLYDKFDAPEAMIKAVTEISSRDGIAHDTAVKHAKRLLELKCKRLLLDVASLIRQKALEYGSDLADIDRLICTKVEEVREITAVTEDKTLADAIGKLIELMHSNCQQKEKLTGTMTCFKALNDKGGLQSGDLIIIAGESSQGKTSLALSMVRAAMQHSKIAMYSMEMTSLQIAARVVSGETGIPSSDLLYSSTLTGENFVEVGKASTRIIGENLYIDERSTTTLGGIIDSIRRLHRKYGIAGAVVDYLQILNVNTGGRTTKSENMATAARLLKNLAKELGIWIIALSQLNRDLAEPMPNLNRLRDSGEIVEAADIVMFVYRPEVYQQKPDRRLTFPSPFETVDVPGKACIMVAKGRNIGIFNFLVKFNAETTTFSDFGVELAALTDAPF